MRGPLPCLCASLLGLAPGLVACGPRTPPYDTAALPSDASGGGDDGEGEPDAEVAAPSPSWEAEEVVEAVSEALATGFPNPRDAQEAYFRLMAMGDTFCPGSDTQITDSYLYGCLASSGVHYMGIAEYLAWSGPEAEELGWATYEVLAGDFVITDVDEAELRVGGGISWTRYLPEGGEALGPWGIEMGGSWLDESRGDWLGQGVSAMLFMAGTEPDEGGELWVDGGVGLGPHDLFFEDLAFAPDACDQPVGRVSVRGPDTWWYTLAFPEGCDACAQVEFQDGAVLGEACVDLAELYGAVADVTVGRP